MLQKLAQVVKTKRADTSDGLGAASFLNDQIEQHYFAFEALPDESPADKLNL